MAGLVIGVDIGDKYIDAVVVKDKYLLSKGKSLKTAKNRLSGIQLAIKEAIGEVLTASKRKGDYTNEEDVINHTKRVVCGTTHIKNALMEGNKSLQKVAVLRLCGTASRALPPFSNFDKYLKDRVYGGYALLDGGFEVGGKQVISQVNKEEIETNVTKLWNESGIRHFVICGIFSYTNNSQENDALQIIKNLYGEASITLSYEVST